jgi:hypothetical protein
MEENVMVTTVRMPPMVMRSIDCKKALVNFKVSWGLEIDWSIRTTTKASTEKATMKRSGGT